MHACMYTCMPKSTYTLYEAECLCVVYLYLYTYLRTYSHMHTCMHTYMQRTINITNIRVHRGTHGHDA